MDLGNTVAVSQLIANVTGSLQVARDLAKGIKDQGLREQIGEAYSGLLDLKERLLALDEENRRLKEELQKKAEIEGPRPPFGYYFDKQHPDSPLCPQCYQKDSVLAYMGPVQPWNRGERRQCRICGLMINEKEMDHSPRPIQPHTKSHWME